MLKIAAGGSAMFESLRRSRAICGMVAVGAAVAVSSFGIVRADRANPDVGKIYHCSTGAACVGGRADGRGNLGRLGDCPDRRRGGRHHVDERQGRRPRSEHGNDGFGRRRLRESSNGNGVVGVSLMKASSGVHGFNDKGVGVTAESKGSGTFALVSIGDSHNTAIFHGFNSVSEPPLHDRFECESLVHR